MAYIKLSSIFDAPFFRKLVEKPKMKPISLEMIHEIFPNSKKSKLDLQVMVDIINDTFDSPDGLNTVNRQASFLAQCAHESGSFTIIRENLNYSAVGLRKTFRKYFPTDELAAQYARQQEKIGNRVYASRMGNGPESTGDGYKYRGRGFIQLTGKNNYMACGEDLNLPLVLQPEILETVEGATRSAMWFWHRNSLNRFADADDIRTQTKVINGGYNGLDERTSYYEKCKTYLAN